MYSPHNTTMATIIRTLIVKYENARDHYQLIMMGQVADALGFNNGTRNSLGRIAERFETDWPTPLALSVWADQKTTIFQDSPRKINIAATEKHHDCILSYTMSRALTVNSFSLIPHDDKFDSE